VGGRILSSPIEKASARTVGVVEAVAPGEITVLLDLDAPQAVTLHADQPQRFPRLNGFVLMPNEMGALVGIVSSLGVERSPYPKRPGLRDFGLVDLPFPLRKMRLVPLGTLVANHDDDVQNLELRRGVLAFPSVGDPVVLPTAAELRSLVEARGPDQRVTIGTSPIGADIPVSVDPDKLFGRHLAVLGNTGSGKSCSVAGLVRWSLEAAGPENAGAPNARFIVLDPNGEYRDTFGGLGDVRLFEVSAPDESNTAALKVPAWLWNSQEWAAFARAAPGTQRPLLMQALRNLRAGETLLIGAELRLARVLRGFYSQLSERIARGPSGYSGGFRPNKECGQLLTNISTVAEHYIGKVVPADEALRALAAQAGELAADRRYDWKGTQGYNDFVEPELEAIRDALDSVLTWLPEVKTVGGANEDAPIPFAPGEVADHLDLLARQRIFSMRRVS
jgi:hypothetical protein